MSINIMPLYPTPGRTTGIIHGFEDCGWSKLLMAHLIQLSLAFSAQRDKIMLAESVPRLLGDEVSG